MRRGAYGCIQGSESTLSRSCDNDFEGPSDHVANNTRLDSKGDRASPTRSSMKVRCLMWSRRSNDRVTALAARLDPLRTST